jgi:high affinity Mn2+ porin
LEQAETSPTAARNRVWVVCSVTWVERAPQEAWEVFWAAVLVNCSSDSSKVVGWTDCDRSLSFGTVLKGTAWGRPDDRIGIGGVVEGLSPIARAYFAAGGLGILIGDGQLNYRPEQILEIFYAFSVNKWATMSFDYQFVDNPGYNADRGPVSIFSGRLHAQF